MDHNITRGRIPTYYSFCLFFTLWSLVSCKENSNDWIHHTGGHSILDLEYINDTLGINLKDIRITEFSQDSFRLQVYLLPDEIGKFGAKNRFFIHFYPDYTSEKAKTFIALGTHKFETKNGVLIFKRDFKINQYWFPHVRYGLLDENGNRLFTLTIDSVRIKSN